MKTINGQIGKVNKETGQYEFPCGCKFKIVGPPLFPKSTQPALELNWDEINSNEQALSCRPTFDLIGTGKTKMCFQLEKGAGRQGAKKLKPENMEQIAALGSILRPGCISASTPISVSLNQLKNGTVSCDKMKMRDLFRLFHEKKDSPYYHKSIVSVDEQTGLFFKNKIVNIVYSGKKNVYKPIIKTHERLTDTKSFYNLECTLDHPIWTHDNNYVQLGDLKKGERIAVLNRKNSDSLLTKNFKGEKYYRSICYLNYKYQCVFCDWAEGSLDVNHLEGNRKTDNSPENLCYMCPNHHRMFTENTITAEQCRVSRGAYVLKKSPHVKWVEYVDMEFVGSEDTYDIEVEGPFHNFVAGNVVVHNCASNIDDEGISTTDHYCRRKNGEEEVESYHPVVDEVLKGTYNVLCIHEDSFVSLYDGSHKQIKNIVKGDIVHSLNTDTNLFEPKECMGSDFTKVDDGYKITLQNNYCVTLTDDHEIYTSKGTKAVKDLGIGDLVTVASNLPSQPSFGGNIADWLGTDEDIAYFFGQLVGDGSICSSMSICSGEERPTDILIEWLRKRLPSLTYRKHFYCRSWYIAITSDVFLRDKNYGNRKKKVHKLVEDFGLKKSCLLKEIPEQVFRSPPNIRHAFLAGLFDSDGHASVTSKGFQTLHFASSSNHIIEGVRQLLALDGIVTCLDPERQHIHVYSQQKFIDTVFKYVLNRKISGRLLTGDAHGTYHKQLIFDAVADSGLSRHKYCLRHGLSKTIFDRKKNNEVITYKVAKKFGYNFGDIRYMEVKKIERVYGQRFHDMSVKDHHNLVANGIVVKNCFQEQSMRLSEVVAGFTKQEADTLRKIIGKKQASEMSKIKKVFLDGARKLGIVTDEQAAEIFGWIQESQRYSFNKCISPSTTIETPDGFDIVGNLKIGDKVKSPYGFLDVLNVYDTGEKELHRVVVTSGRYVDCTMDHKFLCEQDLILPLRLILISGLKIACEDGSYKSIISAESVGVHKTVDIEVDHESHLYYAEGMVTSNSHAAGYGMTSFKTAYSKVHFPVLAYTGWLKEAREKQKPLEEMAELVDDAKYFGIDVYPPDITDLYCNFYTDGESITYGISNVKSVGETTARETVALIKEAENRFDPPKYIKNFTWYEFLILCGYRIKKTVMENLIKVGAFRKFGLKRQQLLAEYEALCEVNEKEMIYILENMSKFTNIADLMENAARKKEKGGSGGACHNKLRADKLMSRVEMLRNPIQPYVDNPNEIATDEANLLGIAITCSLADGKPGERWTVTCKDCLKDTLPKVIILKVKVEEVKEHILKRGKEENIGRTMSFLKLSDATCSLSDISVFCDQWDQFKDLLCVGRVLEIHLEKGHKDNRLHVEHVWEI